MAKVRSPAYPVIGLPEAIEKISLVYKKDYQNKVPRDVVAQHMGYQSLNGKSLGVLSAVAKFGLLEGRGNENWVSDLALVIIAHDHGSPERIQAIQEAAGKPELFAELQARFSNGGSDAALRSYLLTRKFIPQAAELAIRSFRETMSLVAANGGSYFTPDSKKDDATFLAPVTPQNIDKIKFSQTSETASIQAEGEREYFRHNFGSDCQVRLFVKGKMTSRELRKLRHIIYLSELWEAEGPEELPAKADEVVSMLDEATKPQ